MCVDLETTPCVLAKGLLIREALNVNMFYSSQHFPKQLPGNVPEYVQAAGGIELLVSPIIRKGFPECYCPFLSSALLLLVTLLLFLLASPPPPPPRCHAEYDRFLYRLRLSISGGSSPQSASGLS